MVNFGEAASRDSSALADIFVRFLYKDRTRKFDPKAHEKYPIVSNLTTFSPFQGLLHEQLQAITLTGYETETER